MDFSDTFSCSPGRGNPFTSLNAVPKRPWITTKSSIYTYKKDAQREKLTGIHFIILQLQGKRTRRGSHQNPQKSSRKKTIEPGKQEMPTPRQQEAAGCVRRSPLWEQSKQRKCMQRKYCQSQLADALFFFFCIFVFLSTFFPVLFLTALLFDIPLVTS